MKFYFRRSLAFLLFIGLFILPSCSGDSSRNESEKTTDDIALGKACLERNEGAQAAEAFQRAYLANPMNTDARFGLILSHAMEFVNFIDSIITNLDEMTLQDPHNTPKAAIHRPPVIFNDEQPIHEYLNEVLALGMNENSNLYEELARGPDFTFTLDHYALQAAGANLLDLRGDFHKTDLHLMGAVSALMDGLLKFLVSLDLRFDYTALVLQKPGLTQTTQEQIAFYMNMLDNLLHSDIAPTFLCVEPHYGAENLKQAGIDFGDVFARLLLAFDSLAAQGASDADSPMGYIDEDRSGAYNSDADSVYIGAGILLDATQAQVIIALCRDLAPIFYEGSPLDADPSIVTLLSPATLNGVLEAFGLLPLIVGDPENPIISITGLPETPSFDLGGFFSDPQPCGFRGLLNSILSIYQFFQENDGGA